MKSNGFELFKHQQTLPNTRPKLVQLQKIVSHRNKMVRKRDRLLNLNRNTDDAEMRAKIAFLDSVITKNNFQIVTIQSQLGSFNNAKPAFNRQEVSRSKSIKQDRGKILYSSENKYDVKDHRGFNRKERVDSIIIEA